MDYDQSAVGTTLLISMSFITQVDEFAFVLHVLSVNPVYYFVGPVLLIGVLLLVYFSPDARFLLRRLLQFSWPTTEGTLAKAGVVSTVSEDSVLWDSIFQVSYLAAGKPVFGYYGLRSTDAEPREAEKLQSAWDGAKVPLRYDRKHPETFVLDKNYTGGYYVVYLPEFSGSSIAGSPDPLALPKNVESGDQT